MTNDRLESGDEASNARRDFLKKSGRIAVAAPAVALLLAAQSKSALAGVDPYTQPPVPK